VSPFIKQSSGGGVLRVGHLPIRAIPVIPVHLSMAAARKVAALKQIALLLVERDEQIVGTIEEHALAAGHDAMPVADAMRALAPCLRPSTPVAEAREQFIRARAAILPVAAGGFILGAVTRAVVERARR
jgi:hypothetical protein